VVGPAGAVGVDGVVPRDVFPPSPPDTVPITPGTEGTLGAVGSDLGALGVEGSGTAGTVTVGVVTFGTAGGGGGGGGGTGSFGTVGTGTGSVGVVTVGRVGVPLRAVPDQSPSAAHASRSPTTPCRNRRLRHRIWCDNRFEPRLGSGHGRATDAHNGREQWPVAAYPELRRAITTSRRAQSKLVRRLGGVLLSITMLGVVTGAVFALKPVAPVLSLGVLYVVLDDASDAAPPRPRSGSPCRGSFLPRRSAPETT
jgi:hypothetical protein